MGNNQQYQNQSKSQLIQSEKDEIKIFENLFFSINQDLGIFVIEGEAGLGQSRVLKYIEYYCWMTLKQSKSKIYPINIDTSNLAQYTSIDLFAILRTSPYNLNVDQMKKLEEDIQLGKIGFIILIDICEQIEEDKKFEQLLELFDMQKQKLFITLNATSAANAFYDLLFKKKVSFLKIILRPYKDEEIVKYIQSQNKSLIKSVIYQHYNLLKQNDTFEAFWQSFVIELNKIEEADNYLKIQQIIANFKDKNPAWFNGDDGIRIYNQILQIYEKINSQIFINFLKDNFLFSYTKFPLFLQLISIFLGNFLITCKLEKGSPTNYLEQLIILMNKSEISENISEMMNQNCKTALQNIRIQSNQFLNFNCQNINNKGSQTEGQKQLKNDFNENNQLINFFLAIHFDNELNKLSCNSTTLLDGEETELLKNLKQNSILGKINFLQDDFKLVTELLKKIYQNNELAKIKLIKVIKASAIINDFDQIAGNALTILNYVQPTIRDEDFSKIQIKNSSIDKIRFHKCNFQNSVLVNIDLSSTNFIECNLKNSFLNNATLDSQDQISIKDQYLQLLINQIPTTRSELLIVNKSTQQRYKMPIVTKTCKYHPSTCFEFQEVIDKINAETIFHCESQNCQGQASQINDLLKDIRWQAYQEFNELVMDIQLFGGLMLNKLNKKYNIRLKDICEDQNFQNYLNDIYNRFTEQNSIISLLKTKLVSKNQKQKNQRIYYWAICLLEKASIGIPIRILNCNHIECYDLSSLLLFFKETKEKSNLLFKCRHSECKNQLKMSTLNELFAGIVIDIDLLNVIKKGNPSIQKFYFNFQTMNFEQEAIQLNGKRGDFAIMEFYKKVINGKVDDQFQEFQENVQKKIIQTISMDQDQRDKLKKYTNYELNMKDQITGLIIEYPARCKFCNDLTKCCDLRTIVADYFHFRNKDPNGKYQCLLCKTTLGDNNRAAIQLQIQNFIQMDQNLLSRMFSDMSYIQTEKFKYDGEKYMLQEFQERQKYPLSEYKQNLQEINHSLLVNFENLFCSYSKLPKVLENPLLLKKCKKATFIDFSTFYNQLQLNDFDLSNGIVFCDCEYCQNNPLKEITGAIYFHEGVYQMLKVLKNNNVQILQNNLISFDFQKMIQSNLNNFTHTDKNANQKMTGQEGFAELLNDAEYKAIFQRNQFSNHQFQITQIEGDGVYITLKKPEVTNIKSKKNVYAEESGLNKWGFKVSKMQVVLLEEQMQKQ